MYVNEFTCSYFCIHTFRCRSRKHDTKWRCNDVHTQSARHVRGRHTGICIRRGQLFFFFSFSIWHLTILHAYTYFLDPCAYRTHLNMIFIFIVRISYAHDEDHSMATHQAFVTIFITLSIKCDWSDVKFLNTEYNWLDYSRCLQILNTII